MNLLVTECRRKHPGRFGVSQTASLTAHLNDEESDGASCWHWSQEPAVVAAVRAGRTRKKAPVDPYEGSIICATSLDHDDSEDFSL